MIIPREWVASGSLLVRRSHRNIPICRLGSTLLNAPQDEPQPRLVFDWGNNSALPTIVLRGSFEYSKLMRRQVLAGVSWITSLLLASYSLLIRYHLIQSVVTSINYQLRNFTDWMADSHNIHDMEAVSTADLLAYRQSILWAMQVHFSNSHCRML